MRVLVQNTITNQQWVAYDAPSGFLVGRDPGCQVILPSKFVSALHARVDRGSNGWELELLPNVNPVEVDGKEVRAGQRVTLVSPTRIHIIEFILTLESSAQSDAASALPERLTELQNVLHTNVLRRLDLRVDSWSSPEIRREQVHNLGKVIDDLLFRAFKEEVFQSDLTPFLLHSALKARLSEKVFGAVEGAGDGLRRSFGANPELEDAVGLTVRKLSSILRLDDAKKATEKLEETLAEPFDAALAQIAPAMLENARTYAIVSLVKKLLYDMIFGLGPLEELLHAPGVSEIMVVHPLLIFVERGGRIVRTNHRFPSTESAVSVVERIVAPLGRRIDRSQPLVDARLRDGSRVNAVIEPLAVKGPCITIRKFPKNKVSIDDLVRWQALSTAATVLLDACVRYRTNVIVAGGTGSGKTTLLNALSSMIPASERLVTIEDSAELRLQQEHVVTLETRPANSEGAGAYSIRDLVKNALRMRPDRIIVGECRGEEAVDMLQAMNTGHSGSMTTLHANSAADVVARLETMVLMGVAIPIQAVRRQIAQAINLIVFVERLANGRRLVSQITEVIGLHPISGEVETRDIMRVIDEGGTARVKPTGYMPTFLGELVDKGFLNLAAWFETTQTANAVEAP